MMFETFQGLINIFTNSESIWSTVIRLYSKDFWVVSIATELKVQ